MQVHKIFNSSSKQLTNKPTYQRPVYKSYRQLLQLDRPRKKIQYESSSSQQDFLQKLLNQQKAKSKQKRKKSRKSTRQSARTRGEKFKAQVVKKPSQDEPLQKKPKNKFMDEIEAFLTQKKNPQTNNHQQQQEKQQIQNKPTPPPKTAKSKSSVQTKNFQRYDRSKQTARRDVILNNPIFIETKSAINPPIKHASSNHMLAPTLAVKRQDAYRNLISLKNQFQKKYSLEINPLADNFAKANQIKHMIKQSLCQNFTYAPNIQPLNPNWRINLTINPLAKKQKKQYPDRKVMFKSEQEEQRFIRSLSQFRSIK